MTRKYTSNKFLQRKKKIIKIKIVVGIFLLTALIVGFFYWMNHSSMRISEFKIVGNKFSDSEVMQKIVEEILDEKTLFVIPNDNVVFLPKKKIQSQIENEIFEVSAVDFDLKNFDKFEIEIFEHEPKAIYTNGGMNYFVNSEGRIFMQEPLVHSFGDLTRVYFDSNDIKIGDTVVNSDFISMIDDFIFKLKKIGIDVTLVSNENADIYYLNTKQGYYLVISSKDSLDDYYKNIKTIFDEKALTEEQFSELEYMDLRFGNKVFYKFED